MLQLTMAALEAATQPASVSEQKEPFARTDVRALGGRVVKLVLRPRFARSGGPGHDEWI